MLKIKRILIVLLLTLSCLNLCSCNTCKIEYTDEEGNFTSSKIIKTDDKEEIYQTLLLLDNYFKTIEEKQTIDSRVRLDSCINAVLDDTKIDFHMNLDVYTNEYNYLVGEIDYLFGFWTSEYKDAYFLCQGDICEINSKLYCDGVISTNTNDYIGKYYISTSSLLNVITNSFNNIISDSNGTLDLPDLDSFDIPEISDKEAMMDLIDVLNLKIVKIINSNVTFNISIPLNEYAELPGEPVIDIDVIIDVEKILLKRVKINSKSIVDSLNSIENYNVSKIKFDLKISYGDFDDNITAFRELEKYKSCN